MSGRRVTRASTAAGGHPVQEPVVQQPDGVVEESPPVRPKDEKHPRPKRKRGATTKAEGPAKKKKATSTPVAPVKGGWVLPHGMGIAVDNISSKTVESTTDDDTEVKSDTAKPSIFGPHNNQVITADTNVTTNEVPVGTSGTKGRPRENDPKPTTASNTRRQTRASTAASRELTSAPQTNLPPTPPPKEKLTSYIERSDTDITKSDKVAGEGVVPRDLQTAVTRQARKASRVRQDVNSTDSETQKPVVALIDQKMKVKRGTANKYGLTRGTTPYPHRHAIPSKNQCEEVHSLLTDMHGEVKQPAKAPAPSLDKAGCGEVPSVLDALLRTLISGNTLMANADAAVKRLAESYGILTEGVGAGSINWNAVRLASLEKLSNVIRPAGCPKLKGGHIKAILDMVYEEQKVRAQAHLGHKPVPGGQNEDDGQKALEIEKVAEDYLSLDHMHAMTADEAITAFVRYPGIGVKTAACVVLFCLRIPCFAVDTHVHKFCVWLGWVPEKANELNTFNHGEFTVPDHLKYGLHQLFIRHGQQCFKCRKNTKPGTKAWDNAPICPLEHLLDRSKGNFGRSDKEDDEEEMDDIIEPEDANKATKKMAVKLKRAKKEADTGTEDDETQPAKPPKVPKPPKRSTRGRSTKNEVGEEHAAGNGDVVAEGIASGTPKKQLVKQAGKPNVRKPTTGTAASKTESQKITRPVDAGQDIAVDDKRGAVDNNYKFMNSSSEEQEIRSKVMSEAGR